MKLVAAAVLLVALSCVAHPFIQREIQLRDRETLAAQCWSAETLATAASIVKADLATKIIELPRDASTAKPGRAQLESNITVTMQEGAVEALSREAGSVSCVAQVSIKFRGFSSDSYTTYSVMKAQNGTSITLSGVELLRIFTLLDQVVAAR